MKKFLGQLKNSAVELLAFFLVVILLLSFILPITSLWGLTFYDVLDAEIGYVYLDTETSYNEMIAEQSRDKDNAKGFDELS